jgi:hypothetical protein
VDQNVHQGDNVLFRARTDGTHPVFYQWLFEDEPIEGATNSFLILNNVQPWDEGEYSMAVWNQWGYDESEPAFLEVDTASQPPVNTNDPPSLWLPSLELLDPGVALITLTATNVDLVTVEWSSDFLTWNPLQTITNRSGLLYLFDSDAASQPQRFYRATASSPVEPPPNSVSDLLESQGVL